MAIKLNGTNTEASPAFTGDDTDTGLQCGTNELSLVTGGSKRATADSNGNFGIGATANAATRLDVSDASLIANFYNTDATSNGSHTSTLQSYGYSSTYWNNLALSGNNLLFQTFGATRARITNDGLCFGSDTSANNALDDYEEGTWTPGLRFAVSQSGSFTYSANNGARYTKIGRVVYINGLLEWTNHSLTAGTALQLTGLPFPSAAGNATRGGISITYSSNPYTGITVYQHAIRSESAADYMNINYSNATDGSIDNVPNYNQVSTSGTFIFFGMYIV